MEKDDATQGLILINVITVGFLRLFFSCTVNVCLNLACLLPWSMWTFHGFKNERKLISFTQNPLPIYTEELVLYFY